MPQGVGYPNFDAFATNPTLFGQGQSNPGNQTGVVIRQGPLGFLDQLGLAFGNFIRPVFGQNQQVGVNESPGRRFTGRFSTSGRPIFEDMFSGSGTLGPQVGRGQPVPNQLAPSTDRPQGATLRPGLALERASQPSSAQQKLNLLDVLANRGQARTLTDFVPRRSTILPRR